MRPHGEPAALRAEELLRARNGYKRFLQVEDAGVSDLMKNTSPRQTSWSAVPSKVFSRLPLSC